MLKEPKRIIAEEPTAQEYSVSASKHGVVTASSIPVILWQTVYLRRRTYGNHTLKSDSMKYE